MTFEQHNPDVRHALLDMGFSEGDIDRAVKAGHNDIVQAVDFLSRNPSAPPEKNAIEFPVLPGAQATTSATSARPTAPARPSASAETSPAPVRTLTNARDSFDRIQLNRLPDSDAASGTKVASGDDQLQKVIEMSRREQHDRDMEKAIELSKQDGESAVQQQDQDPQLIRAIQESLKDNPRLVTDRAVSWQSHGFTDPKDRIRNGVDEPVGLKNIGNTCYLNSLLQVYYHLPDFRRAVMAFRAPEGFIQASVTDNKPLPSELPTQEPTVETPEGEMDENETPQERLERKIGENQLDQSFPQISDDWAAPVDTTSSVNVTHAEEDNARDPFRHEVQFVVELQKLFAAIALGNQNCVDPSGVAHAMRDSEGKPIVIGDQQDASEFNHLFLDIVEKGLRSESVEVQSVHEEQDDTALGEEMGSPVVKMDDSEEPENVVKDMFTIRFRQEIRRISNPEGNGSEQEPVVTINGETNSIIVDATAKSDRNLHSGLDDYAYAQIDYKFAEAKADIDLATPGADSQVASPNRMGPPVSCNQPLTKGVRGEDEDASPAVKTVWFTRMPPVFVVYLQRVSYNLKTKQAEKVHAKYDFSSEIAFDRYLEENREAAVNARVIVQGIREKRRHLSTLLNRFETFPDGEDVTRDSFKDNGLLQSDISMQNQSELGNDNESSTIATSAALRADFAEKRPAERPEDFFTAARRVQARLAETLKPASTHFAVESISQEKLQTAMDTLRAVVEQDRSRCTSIRQEIQSLKEDEVQVYSALGRLKYRLHAVLVHDGAPSSGHYWTFIRDWNADSLEPQWMKLSDSAVTVVNEEEMLAWSTGGKSRASAYCLIYAVESTLDGKYKNGMKSISEESLELLPTARIEEVKLSSEDFERELAEKQAGGGR